MTAIDDLRRATNEPQGDSMYNDDQLKTILAGAGNDLPAAAAMVWREKAAKFSELVNMREGESARDLSDMATNALRMAKMYQDQSDAQMPSGRRGTTIGRITRA